jgi:hypothetical protein
VNRIMSVTELDADMFVTKPMPISSLPCSICRKPVDLKNYKTDENGQAICDERLLPGFSHPKSSLSRSPSKDSRLVR